MNTNNSNATPASSDSFNDAFRSSAPPEATADTARFLNALYEGIDGHIEVRLVRDRPPLDDDPGHSRQWRFTSVDDLTNTLPLLRKIQETEGRAIHLGVLPRASGGWSGSNGKSAKVADIRPGRVAWADIDYKDVAPEVAQKRIAELPVDPSIIVHSGRGLHLYWLLAGLTPPCDIADLNQRVAFALGADHCHDSTRILRMPGTFNLKACFEGRLFVLAPEKALLTKIVGGTWQRNPLTAFDGLPSVKVDPAREKAKAKAKAGNAGKKDTSSHRAGSAPTLPPRVAKLVSRSERLRDLFEGRGKSMDMDTSNSGYDLSFACALVRLGIEDPTELAASIHARPRTDGAERLERDVQRCVEKALAVVRRDGTSRADPNGDHAKAPDGESTAEEIARVRKLLNHPPGAKRVAEDGSITYVKPPLSTILNLQILLENDGEFQRRLSYNAFTHEVLWDGAPIEDHTETELNCMLQERYKLSGNTVRVSEVARLVARNHTFHPVRDYLARVCWDGVPRIDRLFADYCGAEDDPLNHVLARRWLFGCIARVMRTGCQMDTTLILAGPQGVGKSSFFRALVPERSLYSDSSLDFRSKDAYQQIHGVWIYEVAELTAIRGKDAEVVKAFLTSQEDRYRPPFGRNLIACQRQGVIVGTTNEIEFLDDPSGARRFWPVVVARVDLVALKRDRDQIWAEAMAGFTREGEDVRWHLSAEESAQMAMRHGQHGRTDPWRDLLADFMQRKAREDGLRIDTILLECLRIETKDQSKATQMRVAALLSSLGCVKARRTVNGERALRWVLP